MVRRIRRSTLVTVEVVLALVVAGIAAGVVLHRVAGYVLAGVAALVGAAGLVRRRGRGLVDLVLDRLRDPAGEDGAEDLRGVRRLVPDLHVGELRTRDGGAIGVAGDGQGFVVVLDAGLTAPPAWALAGLVGILVDDPGRPAAVQVLVEQRAPGAADPASGPARAYRSLPVGGVPLWNRVLVAIRHEPAWAPETVEARGGGATGARNALAAIAGRTAARAARDGVRLRPLDAAELGAVLRGLGATPDGEPDGDVVLAASTTREDAVGDLLPAMAALDVARSVLSVTASAVDHSLCAVARLTDGRRGVAEDAAAQLAADGLATPLPRSHDEGVVATLPLGGGARSLEGVVGQVRR